MGMIKEQLSPIQARLDLEFTQAFQNIRPGLIIALAVVSRFRFILPFLIQCSQSGPVDVRRSVLAEELSKCSKRRWKIHRYQKSALQYSSDWTRLGISVGSRWFSSIKSVK